MNYLGDEIVVGSKVLWVYPYYITSGYAIWKISEGVVESIVKGKAVVDFGKNKKLIGISKLTKKDYRCENETKNKQAMQSLWW